MADNMKHRQWFAVYTGYKHEKSARRELLQMGIEAYVPVIKHVRRYVRKIKEYEVPIISHYAFVRIHREEYREVLKAKDVIRFIGFGGKMSPISDEEIDILRRVTGEMNTIDLLPFQGLKAGSKVEVIAGGLTGLKGVVRKEAGKNKFLIDLKTIGYSLSMEVPSKFLRSIKVA